MVFKSIHQDLEGEILAKPILITNSNLEPQIISPEMVITKEMISSLRNSDYQGVYVHGSGTTISEYVLSNSIHERTLYLLKLIYEPNLDSYQEIYALMDEMVHIILNTIKRNISLFSIVSDLSYYDEYTYGHCVNVSALSMMIGLQLGFSEKVISHLGMAGILHDIGKQNIPLAIINKPGRLSEEEFETIRQHPVIGYDFAKRHRLPEDICLGILHHHEKFNGGGYPYNLKKVEISLSGRVLAIADVFDALTHKRSYHEPISVSDTIALMVQTKDFDPYVLSTMEKIANHLL